MLNELKIGTVFINNASRYAARQPRSPTHHEQRESTKRKNKKTGDDGRDDTSYPTKNAKRPN